MKINTTPPTDFLGKNHVRRKPEYVARVSFWSALKWWLILPPIAMFLLKFFFKEAIGQVISDIFTNYIKPLLPNSSDSSGFMKIIMDWINEKVAVFQTVDGAIKLYNFLNGLYSAVNGIWQLALCVNATTEIFEFYGDIVMYRSGRRRKGKDSIPWFSRLATIDIRRDEAIELRTMYGTYDARIVRIPACMWVWIPNFLRHLKEIICGYGNVLVYCPGGLEATMLFANISNPHGLVRYLKTKKLSENVSFNFDMIRGHGNSYT